MIVIIINSTTAINTFVNNKIIIFTTNSCMWPSVQSATKIITNSFPSTSLLWQLSSWCWSCLLRKQPLLHLLALHSCLFHTGVPRQSLHPSPCVWSCHLVLYHLCTTLRSKHPRVYSIYVVAKVCSFYQNQELRDLKFRVSPGIVNRTFENRTQSNSIRGLSSIEFGNRTKSNTTLSVSSISEQIEFNRTNRTQSNSVRLIVFDWVRKPNSIEHN